MSHRYGAENMCDWGIDQLVDKVREGIRKILRQGINAVNENNSTDDDEIIDPALIPLIVAEVDDYFDDYFETDVAEPIVKDVDSHMNEIKGISPDEIYDHYVDNDSYWEVCSERDDLQDTVEKLETRIEELEEENVPHVDGMPLEYVPEKGIFRNPVTLREYKLMEISD